MPTISFASTKGGAGKTTAAVVLATELAERGATVSLIDGDPNQPVSRWSRKPGRPKILTVIGGVTEETLLDTVDEAARQTSFVIVDLEGSANLMVAQAMSRADLVIIPTKGSELDAIEALKVIRFVGRQEKAYQRSIPYVVLITQTSPVVRSRTLKSLEQDLFRQGIPMFAAPLHDRDAYRAIFSFGGGLASLDTNVVGGIAAARANARDFTSEVIARLKQPGQATEQQTEAA